MKNANVVTRPEFVRYALGSVLDRSGAIAEQNGQWKITGLSLAGIPGFNSTRTFSSKAEVVDAAIDALSDAFVAQQGTTRTS